MTEIVEVLTVTEADALAAAEETIARGLTSFREVGEALVKVRDARLYRADYPTFEAYLDGRWGISRRRGYQLIEAAETVAELEVCTTVHTPETEWQARALAPILKAHGPDLAAQVMQTAAAEGKVTAAAITRAATALTQPDPDPEPPRPTVLQQIARQALADTDQAMAAAAAERQALYETTGKWVAHVDWSNVYGGVLRALSWIRDHPEPPTVDPDDPRHQPAKFVEHVRLLNEAAQKWDIA